MTDNVVDNVTYMFGDIEELTEVDESVGGINDTVTIPKNEYEDLLERSAWLNALEIAGVDNWGGIDFAHEVYDEINEEVE